MRKIKLREMHYWKAVVLQVALVLSTSSALVP